MKKSRNRRLGDLLIDVGLITPEQLDSALDIQKKSGRKIGEVLIELGHVDETQISDALEFQLGIPHVELEKTYIPPEVPRIISEKLARRHTLIPIKRKDNILTVAMADPLNIFAIDDIKLATGLNVDPVISTRLEIINAIGLYYEKESAEKALEEFTETYASDFSEYMDDEVLANVENAPVVKLLNSVIKQAIKLKASDIHIEPLERNLRIRFRLDGELQEIMSPKKLATQPLLPGSKSWVK